MRHIACTAALCVLILALEAMARGEEAAQDFTPGQLGAGGGRKLSQFPSARRSRRARRGSGEEEGGGEDAEGAGGLGSTPASELGTGAKVKGPNSSTPNCKTCKPNVIPDFCNYLPASGGGGRRLLEALNATGEKGGAGEEGEGVAGARRLLARRQRTAFQTGRRRGATSTRQEDFKPPSQEIKDMVMGVIRRWQKKPECGMWTKDCVKRYRAGDTMGLKKGPDEVFKSRTFPPGAEELFPDLKPGELGSCAIVAAADTVLGQGRGKEIDSHDTVFRYNGPIKKYSNDIGSKGDVYYWKMRSQERQYGQEGQRASKFYMWKAPVKYYMFGSKAEFPKLTFHGKKILWETSLSTELAAVYPAYQKETRGRGQRHAASGGFKLALSILSSGLCKRVDMYGYSAAGTGRYFKDALVNTVHVIGLEHWVYRQAMEAGMVCIYN